MAEESDVSSEEVLKEPVPVEEMKAQLQETEAQLRKSQSLAEERFDQLMHCRADLDNVMKRAAKEKEDYIKYASEKLICKLLPVLDSLDQAAKHDEGTKVLYQQLLDILKSEGLVSLEAVGEKFDPYRHEALYQVKADALEDNTVAEEIQKGYLFNSRVIRFSKVVVAKR